MLFKAFTMARVFVLLSVILISVYVTEQAYFLQEDYIDKINSEATTWTAGVNFDPNTPKDQILKLLGSKGLQYVRENAHSIVYKTDDEAYYKSGVDTIPETFDARTHWKQCRTIGEVRDQGNCGSCWAVATSSAFTDRLCIATNGTFYDQLSMEEVTFCCHWCGFGCYGGYPIRAWNYFRKNGLVTGGDYGSKEGCQPYRVHPCDYDEYGNNTCAEKQMEVNHRCTRMCYGDQHIDFNKDHRFTGSGYFISNTSIQSEILTYGPVEATFDVYDDFPNYKSGVYVRSKNSSGMGGHAVKLIGWGEEGGVPYWLGVNSWNEYWGDKGFFKILRGKNECGIESSITGAIPRSLA